MGFKVQIEGFCQRQWMWLNKANVSLTDRQNPCLCSLLQTGIQTLCAPSPEALGMDDRSDQWPQTVSGCRSAEYWIRSRQLHVLDLAFPVMCILADTPRGQNREFVFHFRRATAFLGRSEQGSWHRGEAPGTYSGHFSTFSCPTGKRLLYYFVMKLLCMLWQSKFDPSV